MPKRSDADEIDGEIEDPTVTNPEWLAEQRKLWAQEGVGIRPGESTDDEAGMPDDFAIVGDGEDSMIGRLVQGVEGLLKRRKD